MVFSAASALDGFAAHDAPQQSKNKQKSNRFIFSPVKLEPKNLSGRYYTLLHEILVYFHT